MQIALLLFRYFPYGGAQRDCLKVAREARARGHQVRLYVAEWEGEIEPDLEICQLPIKPGSNHRRLQQFAESVHADLDRHPVDVTLSFHRLVGFDAMFAADPCDKARIRKKFGVWLDWLPRYRSKLQRESTIFSATAKTQILLLNPAQQTIFQQYYQTPSSRFSVVNPSVESRFDFNEQHETIRAAIRAQLGVTENDFLLLMVGSDFHTKGVDRVVTALPLLASALRQRTHLFVAGRGDQKSIQALASSLGVSSQVHLLGGRDDVSNLMHGADVLLQTSRVELAGMAIVEALCCGLPVMVSAECGYAFHITNSQAGVVLASPFAQAQLAPALESMLEPNTLLRFQRAALDYERRVDLRSMARQIVDMLERLAQRP